jgi:peptide/nickel transport system ATP-binding protein
MNADALAVENLRVAYRVGGRDLTVVRGLSLRIGAGEAYGLVGESGCGKSTVALAAVRYLPSNGRVTAGKVLIGARDLFALGAAELRRLRMTTVSMVHQDPARALNPSIRVGEQIAEIFRLQGRPAARAKEAATAMLERVRIADGRSVYDRYPHQLSGGMQQRVAIGMALSINPRLLILDEPTTGLDATVEAAILELIDRLRSELGTAVLFISHNLAVVARMCSRIGVLYAGDLIEDGSTAAILTDPRHPYTVALLRCLPRASRRTDRGRLDSIDGDPPRPDDEIRGCVFAARCGLAVGKCTQDAPPLADLGNRRSRCHFHESAQTLPRVAPSAPAAPIVADRGSPPLLEALGVSKTFVGDRGPVRALKDVSVQLWAGETLALVGESGCGKTTLARVLVGLIAPDPGGVVKLDGTTLAREARTRTSGQLKAIQIIFQNPDSALNRSHSARHLIGRALTRLGRIPESERTARLVALARSVRLAERHLDLRPGQLSGGLRQRVAIARAFAGDPRIVVCDEPTSALDASVQAAILNLLTDLQLKHAVSYLFVSHDLGIVRYLSDRIAVLYMGRMMEVGPADRVFSGPHHPYTAALLSAASDLTRRPEREPRLHGDAPMAREVVRGCVFHPNCPYKLGAICEEQEPPFHPGAERGHQIRCHIRASDLGNLQSI